MQSQARHDDAKPLYQVCSEKLENIVWNADETCTSFPSEDFLHFTSTPQNSLATIFSTGQQFLKHIQQKT